MTGEEHPAIEFSNILLLLNKRVDIFNTVVLRVSVQSEKVEKRLRSTLLGLICFRRVHNELR